MPTYEYKCEACGTAFEKFQPITSKPIRKCPKCGKSKVKRLISAGGGLIFKGGGFYITDYRSDAYKDSAKNDTGTKPEAAAKSDAPAKTDGSAKADGPAKADGGAARSNSEATAAKSESKSVEKPKESKTAEPAKSSAKSSGKSKS